MTHAIATVPACPHPADRAVPAAGTRPAAAGDGPGWWRLIETWIGRARQRRDLAGLDDRLLRDLGLTRGQAAREAAQPFWRP